MGRKLKFDTESKILSVRVPLERYDEIKAIVYDLVENRIQNINRIQNQEIDTRYSKGDTIILKKLIIPFANTGIKVDLETNEIERIKELFGEVKKDA